MSAAEQHETPGLAYRALPTVKARLLEGKKGLIVGIANDQSIAWGCARAFRAFGAKIDRKSTRLNPVTDVSRMPSSA